MNYDITKHTAPKMPSLGNGTECIRLLLSQASKDMYEPLVPMFFPVLGAHMSGAEFQYPDLTWKEPCGQMANLVSDTGGNKGHLALLVEAERDTWLHFSRRGRKGHLAPFQSPSHLSRLPRERRRGSVRF